MHSKHSVIAGYTAIIFASTALCLLAFIDPCMPKLMVGLTFIGALIVDIKAVEGIRSTIHKREKGLRMLNMIVLGGVGVLALINTSVSHCK